MEFVKWMSEEIFKYKYRVYNEIINIIKDPNKEIISYHTKITIIKVLIFMAAIGGSVYFKQQLDQQYLEDNKFLLEHQKQILQQKETAPK